MAASGEIVWGALVIQTVIAAVISGSVVGIALKAVIDRRFERDRVNREWKERVLAVVLGPLVMHLLRTSALSDLYQKTYKEKTKSHFHAQPMRESNKAVRSLILANGHLKPASLLVNAQALIQHYDVWLAGFDAKEAVEKPRPESTFEMGFADSVAARDAF
jgi:hypothetical protein